MAEKQGGQYLLVLACVKKKPAARMRKVRKEGKKTRRRLSRGRKCLLARKERATGSINKKRNQPWKRDGEASIDVKVQQRGQRPLKRLSGQRDRTGGKKAPLQKS